MKPELVSGTQLNEFPAHNVLTLGEERRGRRNYWLAEKGKTSGQGFVVKLGSCESTVAGIRIQNTKHPNGPMMGTKKFRIYGSLSEQGPWGERILEEEMEDGRRVSGNPPPIHTFYFRLPVTFQYLRFELVEFFGMGGGLQYFSPVESSLVYKLPGEHHLEQNILLTSLPTLGKQWRLTFDLLPSEYISKGWANCLHLLGKGQNAGERGLLLSFKGEGIFVRTAHSTGRLPSHHLPIIDQWTTIVIDQVQKDGKHLFSVSIGDKEVFNAETAKPEKLVDVKVFASDPKFLAQPGSIRNLVIEMGVDCEEKPHWEDGSCSNSCPSCLCGAMCPKTGESFGEAREGNKTTPKDKQESPCPSGLNFICDTLGLNSLPNFVSVGILLLLLLLVCCCVICLCCCSCVLCQKKPLCRKESDPKDPTPAETDAIELAPRLREISDVRGPIDSFDYQSVACENPNNRY